MKIEFVPLSSNSFCSVGSTLVHALGEKNQTLKLQIKSSQIRPQETKHEPPEIC